MPIKFANNAETTLSSAVSTSATSIPVVDASVFPSITGSDYFLVTLVDSGDNTEIVKVTAVSSNTLTVSRAREGTTARSYQIGDKVENRLTAGGLADLNTRTDVDLDTMTGDGSTTTLTLSTAPASEDNAQVYLDGVYQNKSTYSVSGTTLTFSTAPPSGVAVEVIIITPAAGTFSSSDYATSSQGNKADNALPRSGGAMTGAITTNSTFDGRDVSADGTKLDSIESGATADQTASEIKTAYESNSDTNAFTDSEKTKLNSIEVNATADQSDEEIQDIVGAMVSGNTESGIGVTYDDTSGKLNFAVASQTDNNFTNADHTKLDGIELGATADQTDSEIKTAYENNADTNAFTDSEKSKLSGIESSATGDQTDAEIETAYNAQVSQVSSAERTAGTVTAVRRFSPADIATMAAVHDTLPIGSFILWGSDIIPTNYLLVNQASLSRTTYSALFNVIGTAFGAADSSHFNLPPRGVFIRITAGGSANDPDASSRVVSASGGNTGDNVGSFQSDAIKSHTHGLKLRRTDADGGGFVPNNNFPGSFRKNTTGSDQTAGGLLTDRDPNSLSHTTESITGSETRPKNVNFHLIVKYAA